MPGVHRKRRSAGRSGLHARRIGISQKWNLNALLVVLVVLMLVVTFIGTTLRSYYYGTIHQYLLSRSDYTHAMLLQYQDDYAGGFDRDVEGIVRSFSDKDRIELMVLDHDGDVIYTSSGFPYSSETVGMDDFEQAMLTEDGIGFWTGELEGQNVMALTRMIPIISGKYAAFRYMTSLETVDRLLRSINWILVLISVGILLLVLLIGILFTRSLLRPIREIGAAAGRIAGGDFRTRVSRHADDELGELCNTVNSMADALETSERLKNEFISSVSHELRTPLTAIQGWSETLMTAGCGEIGPEEQELLLKGMRVINHETRRLTEMVEELLDFSRMQSGKLSVRMQRIDLMAELEEAILIYQQKARKESITLSYDEDVVLPIMTGDRARLRQVFINIIDNAIKYSEPGGRIDVTASSDGETICIRISDQGIGIAPEALEHVKKRFFKADCSRRGNGIGLAMADEIVALHGGQLLIESELGIGTTVELRLPVHQQEDRPTPPNRSGQTIIEIE